MSWLLKQAEDILNRVDQQTNAALHQHTPKGPFTENQVEIISEIPAYTPSVPLNQPVINNPTPINRTSNVTPTPRRTKNDDESDLINYLNSTTTTTSSETRKSSIRNNNNKSRRSSSSSSNQPDDLPEKQSISNIHNNTEKELIVNLQQEIQRLNEDQQKYVNELQIYKRQQVQYQHQIAESDALLRDLRTRETDSQEILTTKDAQINSLRQRLTDYDQLIQSKTNQYEQLQNEYLNILKNSSTNNSSQTFDYLQKRLNDLEKELERTINDNENLNNINQQLIDQIKSNEKHLHDEHLQYYEQQQQTKQAKSLIQQLEQEMNDYKAKAQRILQTKDKLINKLKDIVQHRSSTPTIADQQDIETIGNSDESTLLDVSLVGNAAPSSSSSISTNWASIQYEELKNENELFKQELQARELTIHTLRNELQESELLIQQTDEQYQTQINQLNEQLKDKESRLILIEQDYRKLKQELNTTNEDFHKQKQMYQGQITERERDNERLRLQLTSKTINHVNDEELEKRLQILTESLIHKQTIIESLQTDKSSLTMQLERLEKRLDDYETITSKNSFQPSLKISSAPLPTTSISIDDNENYENLRYRMPLLRETPYDVDLTKKVKRAANQIDQFGILLTSFLRRYPIVRLGVLFYVVLLHLWTFIVLFTYTPEVHSSTNSNHLNDKL